MRFLFREVIGWLLVVGGLLALYECYGLIVERRLFEAGPLCLIGIVVFRGGIHLLKVAVAARICLLARERIKPDRTARKPPAVATPTRAS
jgi:hypothetical protein